MSGLSLAHPEQIVDRLKSFQAMVRDLIVRSRDAEGLHEVIRSAAADTIYRIDADVEPLMAAFFRDWAIEEGPLVLVAEGLEDASGNEVDCRVFPDGAKESDAAIRILVDPIDGTRGLMYDKRAAWALAGAAPNKGPGTRLRDIEAAVMTELPTSKMGFCDVLWAVKGRGASGERVNLESRSRKRLGLVPSTAATLEHGFASVSNFFPGTKILAATLMEELAVRLMGPTDVHRAAIFDDQYISTGGQFYELIAGHDRFSADLRPVFYRMQQQPVGVCCHPYDCATWLIAEEAGVILSDAFGAPLDAPMDTLTPVSWVGYANAELRDRIEPILADFIRSRLE